jgi:hypothetical protein
LFSLFPPGFPAVPRYFIQTFNLDAMQISRGKTLRLRCVDAGFIKHIPPRMEDFAGTCPLVPAVPPLVSGSCASPRICGLGFLQTPPRGGALARCLAFGCANTWRQDFPLARSVPCPAHTAQAERRGPPRPLQALVRPSQLTSPSSATDLTSYFFGSPTHRENWR